MTSQFRSAVTVVERIPADKFGRVLSRVLKHFISSLSASSAAPVKVFTDDEAAQLCATFSILPSELSTVIQASRYIFEKAVYNNVDAVALSVFLEESAGMGKAHVAAFSGAWKSGQAREVAIKESQDYTFGCPMVLSSVDWELRMNLAQSKIRKRKDCVVDMSFGLTSPHAGDESTEAFTVEFSHDELSAFFNKIECVQRQLDEMT